MCIWSTKTNLWKKNEEKKIWAFDTARPRKSDEKRKGIQFHPQNKINLNGTRYTKGKKKLTLHEPEDEIKRKKKSRQTKKTKQIKTLKIREKNHLTKQQKTITVKRNACRTKWHTTKTLKRSHVCIKLRLPSFKGGDNSGILNLSNMLKMWFTEDESSLLR